MGWLFLVACIALVAMFPLFGTLHGAKSMSDLVHIAYCTTSNVFAGGFPRFKPF